MKLRLDILFWSLALFWLSLAGCTAAPEQADLTVNDQYLNDCYGQVRLADGSTLGVLRPERGKTSVSDAARGVLYYLRRYEMRRDSGALVRSRELLRFILHMQADNGYFFNHLEADGRIDPAGLDSRPLLRAWTLYAFQALGKGHLLLPDGEEALREEVAAAQRRTARAIIRDQRGERSTSRQPGGLTLPRWLPREDDAQLAALAVIGMADYLALVEDPAAERCMESLIKGILLMQIRQKGHFPGGAFLSKANVWRKANNLQAYALLRAYAIVNKPSWAEAALREIRDFYPQLRGFNAYRSFRYERNALDTFDLLGKQHYPQTAAGIRPMVWACHEAYRLTGDIRYQRQARDNARWFEGANPASALMYNPKTGMAYHSIRDASQVRWEGDLDATLEMMLTLQKLEAG